MEKEEKAFTVKYGSGTVESLKLINRTTCQSLVDGIETIKRFDFLRLINFLILLLIHSDQLCAGELNGQALYNSNDQNLCDRDVGAPLTIKEDTDNSNFPSAYSPDLRYKKRWQENICKSLTLKGHLTGTLLLVSQWDTIA